VQQINKKAFTLFELIIVIVIMGVVYALVLQKFKNKSVEYSSFAHLRETLLKLNEDQLPITLECFGDKCKKCTINKQEIEYSFFNDKPTIYYFDYDGHFLTKEYEYDKCFEFKIYKNKSSSKLFVEKDGQFYLFYPIEETEVYDNFDDAKKAFDWGNFLVSQP